MVTTDRIIFLILVFPLSIITTNLFIPFTYNSTDDVGNSISIQFVSPNYIHITCVKLNASYNNTWIRLLEKIKTNKMISSIKISDCVLPQESFKYLLKLLAIDNVIYLSLSNIANGHIVANDGYFDGLNSVTTLNLKKFGLTQLPYTFFREFTYLTRLDLSQNKLNNLTKELFGPIRRLEHLNLEYNKLSTLPSGVFNYLSNLRTLYLGWNRLIDLRRDILNNLTKLKLLNVSGNNLKTLSYDVFYDLTYLEYIYLDNNNITFLPNGIFANNKLLKSIYVNDNLLSFATFSNLTSLEIIFLDSNNFVHLPEDIFYNATSLNIVNLRQNRLISIPGSVFNYCNELKTLDLGFNELTALNDTLFSPLQELVELHLDNNKLTFLNGNIFLDLFSLKKLYLQGNGLTHLDPGVFFSLYSLQTINLADNKLNMSGHLCNVKDNYTSQTISSTDCKWGFSYLWSCFNIENIILRNNSVKMIHDDWTFLPKLKILDLSYNKFDKLEMRNLRFRASSMILNLTNNKISTVEDLLDFKATKNNVRVILQNNSIICDPCKVYELALYFQNKMNPELYDLLDLLPQNLHCQYPNESRIALLSNLDLYDLQCRNESFCPKNCICSFRRIDETEIIECDSLTLTQISKNDFPQFGRIELLLANKSLSSLQNLSYLISDLNVTKLDLSYNNLKNIEDLKLPASLKNLELNNNQLSYLSENEIGKLSRSSNLKNVSLGNNPWRCNCETKYLLNFLQARLSTISDLDNITCKENGYQMLKLSIKALCNVSLFFIICTSFVAFSIVLAIFVALFVRFKREIKVWLFSHKLCMCLLAKTEMDQNKIYDAFVSHSHLDEAFIVDHLVPGLENESCRFKLCLHCRDWIVGDYISDQMARSMENFRKTIVVLSPNFLNSVWGKIEFKTAHLKAARERRTSVIIILLEDVGPTNKLDPELRAYLSMSTFIKWGDPLFWQKLKYALPHRQPLLRSTTSSFTNEQINESRI